MFYRFLVTLLLLGAGSSFAQDDLSRSATWEVPTMAEYNSKLANCLAAETVDARLDGATAELRDNQADRLDHLIRVLSQASPKFKSLVAAMNEVEARSHHQEILLECRRVIQSSKSPVFQNAVGAMLTQWLVQNQLYDEAIAESQKMDPKESLVPESILFFRATAYHQLLKKRECLATVERLLENEQRIPKRYEVVSKLMAADIGPLKQDSLDEVARLMSDIRRRQFFYRSGKIVRDEEQLVMKKLDRLIEDLESRMKNQQQQSGQPSSGNTPMQESGNAAGLGSGEVRKKTINEGGDWGNLPPAERAKALAEMAKDFPPHYRSVIEEYFRKLAGSKK